MTLEGVATLRCDTESITDAEARYVLRYRTPRPNPDRVVIEITMTRTLGSVLRAGPPRTPAPER